MITQAKEETSIKTVSVEIIEPKNESVDMFVDMINNMRRTIQVRELTQCQ